MTRVYDGVVFNARGWICLAALGAGLTVFLLESVAVGIGARATLIADAKVYVDLSQRAGLFTSEFWFSLRPVGIQLLHKALGYDVRAFIALQVVVHLTVWATLGLTLFRRSGNPAVGVAFAMVAFYLGLLPDVVIWNYAVLTESMTISTLILLTILAVEILVAPRRWKGVVFVALLVYFTTIRDQNAYLAVALIPLFYAAVLLARISQKAAASATIVVLVAFAFTTYSADHAGPGPYYKRWLSPYFNIVAWRVLPDQRMMDYFESHGMPVNEALLRKTRVWATHRDSTGHSFYGDPHLEAFRRFSVERGKQTYVAFLLAHPGETIGKLVEHIDEIVHLNAWSTDAYFQDGVQVDNLAPFSAATNRGIYLVLLSVAMLGAAMAAARGRGGGRSAGFALALSLPLPVLAMMAVSYHGDAMEVQRHSILVPILLKLELLVVAFAIVRAAFTDGAIRSAEPSGCSCSRNT